VPSKVLTWERVFDMIRWTSPLANLPRKETGFYLKVSDSTWPRKS
jgi:hypothetical protein